MTIKAVIFDLDNTLCEYQITSFEALRIAVEKLGHTSVWDNRPDIFNEHHWASNLESLWRQNNQGQSASNEPKFPYGANLGNALRLLRQAGVNDVGVLDEVIQTCLSVLLDHLDFCPGAEQVVQALSQTMRLGLITNGPSRLQWGKIDRLNIRDWFDAIVVSGDVGVEKPDPRIFELVINQLNIVPHQAIYVGDTLHYDVLGARHAGMKSVWINAERFPYDSKFPEPDAEIDHLSQLPKWIKGLSPVD